MSGLNEEIRRYIDGSPRLDIEGVIGLARRNRRGRRRLALLAGLAAALIVVGLGLVVGDNDRDSVATAGDPDVVPTSPPSDAGVPSTTIRVIDDQAVPPIPADEAQPGADDVSGCIGFDGGTATLDFDANEVPSCVALAPDQDLAISNHSGYVLLLTLGPYRTSIESGTTAGLDGAVRAALEPGMHVLALDNLDSTTYVDLFVWPENG